MNNDNYNYDIMLSRTVSRLIRKLLDAVYEGEDEENRMSFSDKELIDDVIRFGTLKDVAKHKNDITKEPSRCYIQKNRPAVIHTPKSNCSAVALQRKNLIDEPTKKTEFCFLF